MNDHMPANPPSSPRASTTTTTGPRSPRRNSRPRKRPRSRRPRSTRARRFGSELFAREKQLLDEMTEIAEAARGRPDARVRKLVDWIRENMCPDLPPLGTTRPGPPARWNETRVIIFTEYDDTKRYLQQQGQGITPGDLGNLG